MIKGYTDIDQSKTLAEILPLESADMYYDRGGLPSLIDKYVTHESIKNDKYHHLIPCWSLAALISIIPQEIFDGEYVINITEGSSNKWILTYDAYENENPSYYGLSTGADNLVDACTDIIIKLKERNFI
jgi:hypothetical protein